MIDSVSVSRSKHGRLGFFDVYFPRLAGRSRRIKCGVLRYAQRRVAMVFVAVVAVMVVVLGGGSGGCGNSGGGGSGDGVDGGPALSGGSVHTSLYFFIFF